MRRFVLPMLALALSPHGAAAGDPLADHRWRDRVLLLYVPAADAPARAAFRERVRARRCAVDERDLLIGEVVADESGSLGEAALDARQARALRSRHQVPAERVTTVLVGKDGGVKLRVDGVADLDAVFRRIDAMPMRRREMAERGTGGCGAGDDA